MRVLIRRRVAFLAALLFALLTPALHADGGPLKPTSDQRDATGEIIWNLEHRHYLDLPIDDTFSKRLLKAYLENLDPGKSFFLQSDVDDFSKLSTQLDDQLRAGNPGAGFVIYDRFRQRVQQRLTDLLGHLDQMIRNFDYTRKESLDIDTKNMAWPADPVQAGERWRKRVKNDALTLRLAGKKTDEIVETLTRRYKHQLSRSEQINPEDVFQLYMNTITGLFDPHTNYLSPRTLENFNISMSLSLEGIGAVLSQEDDYTKIVRLVPAGPADREGELKPADRIVAVGQGLHDEMVNVVGWRLDEVVDLIRGPKDSWVRLEVIPAKAESIDQTKTIAIKRGKVELKDQSAQKEILHVYDHGKTHKVGLIHVPTFYVDFNGMREGKKNYRSTTRDVKRLMGELEADGVDGMIIDLRDNGGGSLDEANDMIGLFIGSGPTVQIRHANKSVTPMGKSESTPYYKGPLVVMTNRLSASASEIFAGAIQDYQRGALVGTRTFGKGTVQALLPLSHGELKLTESKFYRISGDSTQDRGVLPDVDFPAIYDPKDVGESSLKNPLPWDTIAPARHRFYGDITAIKKHLEQLHQARTSNDPDFVYLKEELALIDSTRDRKSISLNENERIAERDRIRKQRLALENRRREAKGLKAVKSLDDDKAPDPADEAADGTTETKDSPEDDLLAMEAAKVLLDEKRLDKKDGITH